MISSLSWLKRARHVGKSSFCTNWQISLQAEFLTQLTAVLIRGTAELTEHPSPCAILAADRKLGTNRERVLNLNSQVSFPFAPRSWCRTPLLFSACSCPTPSLRPKYWRPFVYLEPLGLRPVNSGSSFDSMSTEECDSIHLFCSCCFVTLHGSGNSLEGKLNTLRLLCFLHTASPWWIFVNVEEPSKALLHIQRAERCLIANHKKREFYGSLLLFSDSYRSWF